MKVLSLKSKAFSKPWWKRNNTLLISHALTLAVGILISGLANREDCGDVVLRAIEHNSSPAAGTLRQPPPKLVAAADRPSKTIHELNNNFYEISIQTGTDKVQGEANLPTCLKNNHSSCPYKEMAREQCRPYGHFYHTLYQQKLGPYYSREDAEPFQFLEVGFFNGKGYDAFRRFLPRGECHSIEISCIGSGPREEGKWPWGNFAKENSNYQQYLDENRLHCGDGNDVNFLAKVWGEQMKRPNAPSLEIVVDDGSHLAEHMAQTVLFWLPRIEPGGLLFVEDIQPTDAANPFRTQFLPQIMSDLHYCGSGKDGDEACFPTIMRIVQSIHCEMHICVFERNSAPSKEPSLEEAKLPPNALDMKKCKSMLPGHW